MSLCFSPKVHFSSSFVKLCEKNNTGIIARTNQIAVFSHVTTVTLPDDDVPGHVIGQGFPLDYVHYLSIIGHLTDDVTDH